MLLVLVFAIVQIIQKVAQFGSGLLRADLLVYALVLATEAGVCEEFMVRGLPLANTLFRKSTRKQFVGLVIFTSVIFGVMHIGNLFKGGETIPVIMQIVYAAAMGVVFGAIYLRTGSIIPTIILHALWDFGQFLDPANVANGAATAAPRGLEAMVEQMTANAPDAAEIGPIVFIIMQSLIALVWLFVGLFLMRKSKWEEIKANFTKE